MISEPFRTTADGDNLFLSPSHREALGSILYGIKQRKGVIVVTGEVGVGKTTVLRRYLQIAAPMQENSLQGQKTVHLYNPNVGFNRLLITILHQLGAEPCSDEAAEMIRQLHELVKIEQGHGSTVVLIIDEAQCMPPETLEGIRMLTNLETENEKLIQIVLIGQPELEGLLERHELRHVRERIAVRARILPLTKDESLEYIQFRINQASREQVSIFSAGALAVIRKAAQGVPRRLNILCDNALITGFRRREPIISRRIAKRVVMEANEGCCPAYWKTREVVMVAVSLVIVLPLIGYMGARSHLFSELFPFSDRYSIVQESHAPDSGPSGVLDRPAMDTSFRVAAAALLHPNVPVESIKADARSSEHLGMIAIGPKEFPLMARTRPRENEREMLPAGSKNNEKDKESRLTSPTPAAPLNHRRQLISFEGLGESHAVPPATFVQDAASSEAERAETARLLAVLLDSGRIVLGRAQSTINNPRLDDKGFSSSVFGGRLRKEFLARTGYDLQNLKASAMPELAKPLLLDLSSVMQKAVHDVQADINKKGIGFKGFIPATFGTKVAENFSKETGVKIRQIGPPDMEPRNPNNKPDDQEEAALLAIQKSHPRVGDHVIQQRLPDKGVRVLLPLFYNRSCLSCHGKPKGETDISGYEKEGFKEGDLGGAISVLFPETGKPGDLAREE